MSEAASSSVNGDCGRSSSPACEQDHSGNPDQSYFFPTDGRAINPVTGTSVWSTQRSHVTFKRKDDDSDDEEADLLFGLAGCHLTIRTEDNVLDDRDEPKDKDKDKPQKPILCYATIPVTPAEVQTFFLTTPRDDSNGGCRDFWGNLKNQFTMKYVRLMAPPSLSLLELTTDRGIG